MSQPTGGTSIAIRLAAAGLGAVVAGPLGAAMGGVLGHAAGGVLGEQAARVVETFAHSGGEAVQELSVHFFHDQVHALQPHPHLSAVMRDAVRRALEDVGSRLDFDAKQRYANWFANWDRALGSARKIPFELPEELIKQAAGPVGEQALDSLFRLALERLDGQARAISAKSLSIGGNHFRTMPDELFALVRDRLPGPFESHFQELLTHSANEAAWKSVVWLFQEKVNLQLARLQTTVDKIDQRTARMMELLERQVQNAVDAGRISEAEARAAREAKEKEEWRTKFEALEASVREAQPADPAQAGMLSAGDLDGAARLMAEEIEKDAPEVRETNRRLARKYANFGLIQELRFDWAKALEAYREARRLDSEEPEYSFGVGHFAAKQRQMELAMEAYKSSLSRTTPLLRRSMTLNELGSVYRATGRFEEALHAWNEALVIFRDLAPLEPGTCEFHMAVVLSNVGLALWDLRRPKDAEQSLLDALDAFREWERQNPGKASSEIATTLNTLGVLYTGLERPVDAEPALLEALKMRRVLTQKNPSAAPLVAGTLNNLGILYRKMGASQRAEDAHQEALGLWRGLARSNPDAFLPNLANSLLNNANVLIDSERKERAENLYGEALNTYRRLADTNPETYLPHVATALNNLTHLYVRMGQLGDAEKYGAEAQKILERIDRQRARRRTSGMP